MNGTHIELDRLPLRIVQAIVLLLIVVKLAQLTFTGVFMDESYYWMWGQHPAWSYYDHPPLNAWLLWLSSTLFGWNVFALRLPVALSFFANIFAIYLIARRLCGDEWRGYFWLTLLLFLVTPIYWLVSSLALPDYMLQTCSLFAMAFFIGFFVDRAKGEPGRDRDLYLGALFLGFAGLAKYNAAILAAALIFYILVSHRDLLRQPRLYLAGLLTIAMQAPVIYWNLTENFASWEFVLRGRHSGLRVSYDGIVLFGFGAFILLSPFLIWPMLKFTFGRTVVAGTGLTRWTFVISTIAITVISLTTLVLPHWNLLAYLALVPMLVFAMRPRWLILGQVIWGLVYIGATFVNYAIKPLSEIDQWRDEATAWSYGWAPIAAAVKSAEAEHKIGFIAAADYTTASLLAFNLQDRNVVSLSPKRDEYDYWFDPAAHAGQDAILFGDTWRPLDGNITGRFKQVTLLATVPVIVAGQQLDTHQIYLATGYTPADE